MIGRRISRRTGHDGIEDALPEVPDEKQDFGPVRRTLSEVWCIVAPERGKFGLG